MCATDEHVCIIIYTYVQYILVHVWFIISYHTLSPVAQVCVGKEREERVRLELRVTELEEEMETQTTHMTSVK